MKAKKSVMVTRKQCVWCGAAFYDKRANTLTCGFQCSDARHQEKYRAWKQQKRAPLLYLQSIERERTAKDITWEAIDALFGDTFADIHRP